MKYKIILSPNGKQNLKSIAFWYKQKEGDLGRRFISEFKSQANKILQNPFSYQVLKDEVRVSLIQNFPYRIFYSVNEKESEIYVHAIYGTSQNPEDLNKPV
ncbi:MAG: plasmid stabilization system protein ParE [Flammeovirgaceae bacterium]|jgi:plasmid stabilization system protein ParE